MKLTHEELALLSEILDAELTRADQAHKALRAKRAEALQALRSEMGDDENFWGEYERICEQFEGPYEGARTRKYRIDKILTKILDELEA